MSTLSSCMDRYISRHMIHPPMSHHQTSNQTNYFHQKNIGAGAGCRGSGGGGSHHQQQQQQQPHHHQNYLPNCYQNTNGWTGVPLISTASRRPKKYNNNRHIIKPSNQLTDFDENAMSRLAIHAHGAPLILAGRYRNKSSQHKRDQSKIASGVPFNKSDSDRNCYSLLHHKQQIIHNTNNNNNNVNNSNTTNTVIANGTLDTFSVNSDESSNSSNGINVDTCLPRIIKPRKRRKKDRKPNINAQQSELVQSINNNNNNNCNAIITNNNNKHNNFNCISNNIEPPTAQDNNINTHIGTINSSSNSLPNEIMQRYEQELNDLPEGMTDIQNKTDAIVEETSSCSCRLCDPLCRIWAFPLRRSCSDKSETEIRQNKNVGVIGSNRIMTVRNEWRSSPQLLASPLLCDRFEFIGSRKGSFSDSGDSGCDILSGLSFSDDILRSNSRNDNNSTITSPLTDNLEFNFSTSVTDNSSIFGESINEISRKLMESMDLSGRSSASEDSGSVFSDSVFSDDFFMNFESLQQQQSSELFSAGQTSQMFFNPNQTNHLINDSESIMSTKQNNLTNSNEFVFIEKDRGDEVINCFDMVWSNRRLQPVEE